MKSNTLEALFLRQLKDLYSAETQQLKSLPVMLNAVSHGELQFSLDEHLSETRGQVARLQQIAELGEFNLTGYTCMTVKQLLAEGAELISENAEDHVSDSAIISTARRVVHYEIAAYSSAYDLAKALGYTTAAKLLDASLREEKFTDEELAEVAESVLDDSMVLAD